MSTKFYSYKLVQIHNNYVHMQETLSNKTYIVGLYNQGNNHWILIVSIMYNCSFICATACIICIHTGY